MTLPSPARCAWHAALLASAVVASGCEGGRYTISVVLADPTLRDQATGVEVHLIDSCVFEWDFGEDPVSPVASVAFQAGLRSEELGAVPEGEYGLYARVRDEGCQVLAAGCAPVELTTGGSDELRVTTFEVTVSVWCGWDETCTDGLCEAPPGGDADADSDAEDDAETYDVNCTMNAGWGAPCFLDGACEDGSRCIYQETGAMCAPTCRLDSACSDISPGEEVCVSGYCLINCSSASDCPCDGLCSSSNYCYHSPWDI